MADNKKRYDSISRDLQDILNTYPHIDEKAIDKMTPLFYPIALIDIEVEEQSFADFKNIQLIVLKAISIGIKTPERIAAILGLTPNYIRRTINVLSGYGHVQDGEITELGQLSLRAGKRVELTKQVQRFQMNALTGKLFSKYDIVSPEQMDSLDDSRVSVMHVRHLNRIETQYIEQQIQNVGYSNYVKTDTDVLNINAVNISSIRLAEIKYALSYALKLHNVPQVVLTKRKDERKKGKNKYPWRPISVPSPQFNEFFQLEEEAPITTETEKRYVDEALVYVNEEAEKRTTTDYRKILFERYQFILSEMQEQVDDNKITYYVNEETFTGYDTNIYYLLKDLGQQGHHVFSNDSMYGKIVQIVSQDSNVQSTANLLAKRINEYGDKIVKDTLESKLQQGDQDEALIWRIKVILDSM